MNLESNAPLTSGNPAIALIDEGNALEEQGRLAEAMERYEAAVKADPRCARAHLNRGNILFANALMEEARSAYQAAIACDPKYAAAYFNLANLNCRVGEHQRALREYEIAIRIRPNFADAYVALGNALADLGRNAEAAENYRRAVASAGEGTGVPRAFVTRLFDEYAPRFDHHLVGKLAYSIPTAMRQAADRIFKDRRFHRALDLGCGTGLIGEHFREVVSEIDGVDLSGNMLEQARRKGIYSRLDCDDIVAWILRAAADSLRYDLVVAADVFIYVGDLEPAFSAVRKILVDGGLFVFSVEHLPEGSLELLPSFRYAHSTSYVRGLASAHGFTIELSEFVDSRKEGSETVRGTIFVLV